MINDEPDAETRLRKAQAMVEQGADPDYRTADGGGALFQAILWQDENLIEFLLKSGANPNFLVDGIESLFDFAEFDYRYEAWDLSCPIESTSEDNSTVEAWLAFLDRCAEKRGNKKPLYLHVLRRYGAKTRREIEAET
jgi:ankyrin repeat protein